MQTLGRDRAGSQGQRRLALDDDASPQMTSLSIESTERSKKLSLEEKQANEIYDQQCTKWKSVSHPVSVSRYVMQFEFHSMLIRSAGKSVHHEDRKLSRAGNSEGD